MSREGPVAVNPRAHGFVVRQAVEVRGPAVRETAPASSAGAMPTGHSPVGRTIITPPGKWPHLGLGELWRLRAIAIVIARRTIMVRYRQTALGTAWVLLQPLTLMVAYTAFFSVMMRGGVGDLPYPVYVYIGLVVWMMASRVLAQGSTSVAGNSGLLSKIYFPRAYLPIGVAIGSLVDYAFGLISLIVLLLYFGIVPGITVLAVPFLTLLALAAVLGASFWLAALNAQYRDVGQLLPFISHLWFFATPIFYSTQSVPPQFQILFVLNPVAVAIEGFRWAFAGSTPPSTAAYVVSGTVALLLLVTGYIFFRSREPSFADAL